MRKTTPTFVTTIPLKTSSRDEKLLKGKFFAGKQLYNAFLCEALKRMDRMKSDPRYTVAIKKNRLAKSQLAKNKNDAKAKQRLSEAKALFKTLNDSYGFSEYALMAWGKRFTSTWLNIGSDAVQKVASRVWLAMEKHLFDGGGRPRYKGRRGINSLEGKKNAIKLKDGVVEFNGVFMKLMADADDVIHCHGLSSRIKFIRIVRKMYSDRYRYFAQLVNEGLPYQKPKHRIGQGKVCIDIGPQTIASVSVDAKKARLDLFAAQVAVKKKGIKVIQRKVNRKLRALNPEAFKKDRWVKKDKRWVRKQGEVKKGVKMDVRSNNLKTNFEKLADKQRNIAKHRKDLHGQLANEVLSLGKYVVTENISIKGFQKLYGSSIGDRAPGMFLEILNRKAVNAGGSMEKFSTRTTKLSQACHCGSFKKKTLAERWHTCECCGTSAQRDLYSAFLGNFVENNVLIAPQAQSAWEEMDVILRSAMSNLKPSIDGHYPASMGAKRVSSKSSCKKKFLVGQRGSSGNFRKLSMRPIELTLKGELVKLPEPHRL